SFLSVPAIAVRSIAASVTLRVIGPAVSCECEIGMMPLRETRPTVGFRPTTPLVTAGEMIEPFVSLPIATGTRFAETATPEPELEPLGFWSRKYGMFVWPPRPDQPLVPRSRSGLA